MEMELNEKARQHYNDNRDALNEYHRQRYAAKKKSESKTDVQATEPAAPTPANSDTN